MEILFYSHSPQSSMDLIKEHLIRQRLFQDDQSFSLQEIVCRKVLKTQKCTGKKPAQDLVSEEKNAKEEA